MKKIWIKRFTSLALSLVLLTNSLTPYVLAQEITPSPEPTPTAETTSTPEPTLTATPTPEITPTPTLEVTPEVTPTPLPDTNPVDPDLSTTPSDPVPSPTPSVDLDSPDAQGSAQLTPSLSTDKDDYAPTETVIISGSDYQPNTTYTLVVSSQDEPTVRYETTITSTEDGSIYYTYQLDGIYRPNYLIEIFLGSSLVKSITFTDSTGAIWTSDSTCTATNLNIYANKDDVYLNGGPQGGSSNGLADGNYYVQVTKPDGTLLGKSDTAIAVVSGGEFVECYKLMDIAPFTDTSNPGGEYKVWVSKNSSFPGGQSKTDNFKVRNSGDEEPDPPFPGYPYACEEREYSNDYTDLVNIGDETSESTHSLSGWGPIEPATHGGGWGGACEDGNCRVVYEPNGDNAGTLTLDFGTSQYKELRIRALNGISGADSFEVSIKDVLVYRWLDDGVAGGTETWGLHSFDVSGFDGTQTIKITSLDDPWGSFNTYGQVAVTWLGVMDYTCPGQCVPGPSWAHSVVDYDQGTLKSGGQITDSIRIDPSKTLGTAVSGDDSDFFSLGKDGWITLAFEYPVMDVDGTDLSFHETTWGNRDNYGEEKAKIEVAQLADGPWVEIGTASSLDNDGEVGLKLLDFGFTGWSWIKYVRLTDITDYSLHNNQGDGYDLDAVDATYQICDELDPEPIFSTISGHKWNDIDGDGQRGDEPGLEGWQIIVHPTNQDPYQTITLNTNDSNGEDSLPLTAGRTYLIEAEGTWNNKNGAEHNDADYASNDAWVTHFNYDDDSSRDPRIVDLVIDDQDIDWGSYNQDHLYKTVLEGSGVSKNFKISEAGGPLSWYNDNLGTLTIRIYDVTDQIYTTDQNGFYTATDLEPGKYQVIELNQEGWIQTYPTNPRYHHLTLNSHDELTADFGNQQDSPKISDVTVCKVNEANDPLSGWSVGVLGSKIDTYTVPVNNTSVSTANLPSGDYALFAHGTYRFANWGDAGIADAGYSLRIPGQPYSVHTNPYDTWVSGDELNTPGALEIQVNGNNVDWGLFSGVHEYLYSLSSHPGGPLSFRIYDNVISDNLNSVTNPLSVSVHHGFTGITSENGCTTFKDVPYGDYTLYESLQAGWVNNTGHNTQVTVDSSTEEFTLINLANKSISGFKYEDTGTSTQILSGWAIQLFSCAALGDCSSEPIITTTTTVNGYDFQNLTSGYYLVKEDAREGWSPKQSLSWFVDLVNQQSVQVDFTNARNSSITACKVEDSDGDLSTDYDRTIVTGWPISLYQNDQLLDTQDTGEDGCYTWTDLDPYQSYKIYEEVGDSGSVALTNPEYTFSSLTPNQDHQHTFVNFRMGMVRGYKYHDINADGSQQFYDEFSNPYEGYLNDWEICLVPHQQTDDQEISLLSASESISEEPNCVLTGEDGYYEFTNLGPGSYRIYETPQSGWTQTEPPDPNGYVIPITSGFGIGSGWYNFGNTGSPNLSLTKTNDYKGQVVSAGTKVTYTLVVSNTGDGLASNVEIVDAPPTYGYFEYGADTGQVSCSEGTTQSLTATGTNPYIWTMPVNLLPGQSCTLNYTTTINDSDKIPGTHDNIAFARALGHDKQTYFSDPVIDPFTVGSDSDFSGGVGGGEESGDVLGASTTTGQVLGASTGTPSLWSLLGLLFIALGLALRLPKNSLKKLIPAIFLIISPFVILPSAYAQTESSDTTPPSVSIVKLPPYKNTNSFEISYTALDASQDGLKDVVLRFRREGGSWQDLATYTSTAAKFQLNSSHIIQDDRYYFQAYACDHAGNCASDETSTIVDRELPPAPESFQKAWKDEYAYILKWHNPSSTQSYKVYIYRYHEPVFIAQDASLIAVLDVTPNTDIEWQNSHPEPKPYYYAIRNVDPAGNTSGLVSDPETTATTTTSSSQSAPEGTPVTGSESFSGTKLVAAQSGSGQILGEQDSQDEDQNEEGSEVSPDSDAINQALDQATPEDDQDSSSSIPWRILIIIAVGIILIYIFYIRKK